MKTEKQRLTQLYNNKRKKKDFDFKNVDEFCNWYIKQKDIQNNKCYYCGIEQEKINKCIKEGYILSKRFKTRGKNLEVERLKANEPYNKKNCVLACYFCNNAKSDVFTEEEFIPIAKEIGKVLAKHILRL